MNAAGLLTVYCALILLASMVGGWLPLAFPLTHIRVQVYLSFASGIMLGAALCHMMPEATRLAPGSWFHWTLAGLLGLFFLERFFAFHHHEPEPSETHHTHSHQHAHSDLAWGTALVGLTIHTLTGGFALASAVAAQQGTGYWLGSSVFLATVLHKPADSLTITSLMVSGGTGRRYAHVVNLLFSLVIPLGVLLYFLARRLATPTVSTVNGFAGGALAFSAGTFLSIALGDLMPELQFHRHDRIKLSAALLAGVAVMYASAALER